MLAFFSFCSTHIRVDDLYSVPKQESGQNLESEILLILIATDALLNHANLVIQALGET